MSRVDVVKVASADEKKVPCFKCRKPYFETQMESFKVPSSWNSIRGVISVCTVNHYCQMYADWLKMQKFSQV
jgi:hypothetical protein